VADGSADSRRAQTVRRPGHLRDGEDRQGCGGSGLPGYPVAQLRDVAGLQPPYQLEFAVLGTEVVEVSPAVAE